MKNPIVPRVRRIKDEKGAKINATMYKQLIGSLMYLTATRPNLMHVVSLMKHIYGKSNRVAFASYKRSVEILKRYYRLGNPLSEKA